MSSVIWHVTMSLDGFIAGRGDSMDWVVAQWSDGGENTRDIDVQRSAVADGVLRSAGAILGGRRWYDLAVRKFDGYRGIYGAQRTGPESAPEPGNCARASIQLPTTRSWADLLGRPVLAAQILNRGARDAP